MQPTRFIFNDESDRLGVFRIVFPRDSGASGSTPAARFGGPCTAFQQLCAPRHFLRVTPHGVPLTSLVCSRRERSGRAPRPHIARAPSRAPSRRVNGRAGRFDSGRLPLLSCLWTQPTNRPKRVARRSVQAHKGGPAERSRERHKKSFCNFHRPSGTSQRHKPPPLTSRATRGRSLGRPRLSPSLVKRIDDDTRAPVRCSVRGPRSSCSWEQARPRSSTFTPRHLRHRRATFGDWVLLRVHAAIQIELPRSGAFFRRFPSGACRPSRAAPALRAKATRIRETCSGEHALFPTRTEAP